LKRGAKKHSHTDTFSRQIASIDATLFLFEDAVKALPSRSRADATNLTALSIPQNFQPLQYARYTD